MIPSSLNRLIGNAVVDREFREALLQGREDVYGNLSEEERRLLESLRAPSLRELAAALIDLASSPGPR